MARGDFPSAKQDQYMVRFPDGMREQLKDAARNNGRSLNAEIVQRLEDTLGDPTQAVFGEQAAIASDFAYEQRQLLKEYKILARQRDQLLRAVCLQILMHRDRMPPETKLLADQILSDEFIPPLPEDFLTEEAEARYHRHVRQVIASTREVQNGRRARQVGAIIALWSDFEQYLRQIAADRHLRVYFSEESDLLPSIVNQLVKTGQLDQSSERSFLQLKAMRDRVAHDYDSNSGIVHAGDFEAAIEAIKGSINAKTSSRASA